MTPTLLSLPPVFVEADEVTDPDPLLHERLVARAGLLALLATQASSLSDRLDLDVYGGVGAGRQADLGWVDLAANARLVGIAATPPGADTVWLTPAQLESAAAPDLWAVLVVIPTRGGAWVTLAGWGPTTDLRARPRDADGYLALPLTDLAAPAELYAALAAPPGAPRALTVVPDPALLARLHADPTPDLLSAPLEPAVFDCLIADDALARAYAEQRAAVAAAWRDVTGAADGAAAAAPLPLIEQVRALVQRRRLGAAMRLLKTATTPDLLRLRAQIFHQAGNLTAAVRDARRAYEADPTGAPGLFGPRPASLLPQSWQYAAAGARLAAADVLVLDAAAPDHSPPAVYSPAQLRREGRQRYLSLGIDVPPAYAGYHYRVCLIPPALPALLAGDDPLAFRRSFTQHPDGWVAPAASIIADLELINTATGSPLEGVVPPDGAIGIYDPIQVGRQGDEYLSDKTVVVYLFRPPAGHDDA